jgi:hypothetical protein
MMFLMILWDLTTPMTIMRGIPIVMVSDWPLAIACQICRTRPPGQQEVPFEVRQVFIGMIGLPLLKPTVKPGTG